MMWEKYKLGNMISRTIEDIKLWQAENGVIEISKGTLAIPIELGDQEKGYLFHGQGKLLLDTIVETEEGAIGKSVEEKLDNPFLMLGNTEKMQEHLSVASKEDLTRMGYENQQGFVERAEDLFNRFFKKGTGDHHQHFSGEHGFIFAFENPTKKLDILFANGAKLVYTAKDTVFVSNKNNLVLKSPDEVVCSSNGKSVIIKRGKSVIIKK